MKFSYETCIGRIPLTDVADIHGNLLFKAGVRITEKMANIARFKPVDIPDFEIVPYVTDEIIYIDAETEDQYTIVSLVVSSFMLGYRIGRDKKSDETDLKNRNSRS